MDLRQMRYVLAIVDHGTFTAAAAAMHVAQPSLSQTVRTLEAELGVELFHRTGRSVRLTAAGRAFVAPARQALRDADVVEAAVAAVAGNEAGHLDLVCLPSLAAHPTADLIGAFRQHHPRVTVRLVEPDDPADVLALVRDATCEVGLTELPIEEPDLIAIALAAQEYVAVLPAPLADQVPSRRISLQALAGQPLITTPPGTSTRRQVTEAFAAAGLEPQIAVETDHREAIAALVVAGAGVSILPHRLADDAAARGAIIRTLSPKVVRHIGLVTRSTPLSPAAAAFVQLAHPGGAVAPSRPRPRRRGR